VTRKNPEVILAFKLQPLFVFDVLGAGLRFSLTNSLPQKFRSFILDSDPPILAPHLPRPRSLNAARSEIPSGRFKHNCLYAASLRTDAKSASAADLNCKSPEKPVLCVLLSNRQIRQYLPNATSTLEMNESMPAQPSTQSSGPSPEHFFRSINAYQLTQALKGAIELDVFTAMAEGATTAKALAETRQASERGMRILCDYLVVMGFLTKADGRYALTPDSAMFLDRRLPSYVGGSVEFLLSPTLAGAFNDVAAAVRKGGTVISQEGTMSPDHPVWVGFARAMQPLSFGMAQMLTGLVKLDPNKQTKVLDIAASHGLYGLSFAQQYPKLEVVAVDWANVLEVGRENAGKLGASDRWHALPGSAFEVDFGAGFDLALVPNFFHHFDPPTNEKLMRKIHAALNDGGRAVTVEFVPNEDRTEPLHSVTFALVMLASTASGDAYTFAEYEKMFANAGFSRSELHQLPVAIEQVIISYK
jgi:SAM-dependent methyltransferase